MSVFYGFLYQYFSIQGNAELFHKTKTIVAMFVFAFLYPMPLMVLVAINDDHEEAELRIQKTAPYAYDLFIHGACIVTQENLIQIIWTVEVVIQMGLIYVIALILAWKIRQKFKELRHSMSSASLKAQKQLFFALMVQLMVPFIFIVIPVGGILACVILKLGDVAGLKSFPVLSHKSHSF